MSIEEKTRLLIRDIIVSTIEEIDAEYTASAERENCAYINKHNVPRTIVTAFGTITFRRTYFKSKITTKHFFFVDQALDLPKKNTYDPIVKAIAISNASMTSQKHNLPLIHLQK